MIRSQDEGKGSDNCLKRRVVPQELQPEVIMERLISIVEVHLLGSSRNSEHVG